LACGYENSWHWVRDTQLREVAHRYREENGLQIIALAGSRHQGAAQAAVVARARRSADVWMTPKKAWPLIGSITATDVACNE
jgi:hypothetical protein